MRQLRQTVWWPGISRDVKEYTASCLGCTAAENKNGTPPIIERETSIGPWLDCSADFKGPNYWKDYFHVLIDNYSRWPGYQHQSHSTIPVNIMEELLQGSGF